MVDSFSQTTTTGYGGRLVNSVKGMVVGCILVVVSVGLLYWNEGRSDLSGVSKTAVDISSSSLVKNLDNSSMQNQLISISGQVVTDQKIGDGLFLVPNNYLALKRKTELYSWVEKESSKSRRSSGGSETTTKTYTYEKEWREFPQSSDNFQKPQGHQNPDKSISDLTKHSSSADIGAYHFSPAEMKLPELYPLELNQSNTQLNNQVVLVGDKYLYMSGGSNGTFEQPQVGDLRISYAVLPSGFQGTIFAGVNQGEIVPYISDNGHDWHRLFIGSRAQAIATMHAEYTESLWLFRLIGFFCMWIGLCMLLKPLSVLLDIIPFVGSLTGALITASMFAVSLVFSIVIILVSMLVHSLVALLIALIVVTVVMVYVLKKKKHKHSKDQSSSSDKKHKGPII